MGLVGASRAAPSNDASWALTGWLLRVDADAGVVWEVELAPMADWQGLTVYDAYVLPGGGWRLGGELANGSNSSAGWVAEILRVSAAGAVLGSDPGSTGTGRWDAGGARPGGGLVLGGAVDSAFGWNLLLFGWADPNGTMAWSTTRLNRTTNPIYFALMTDAVSLPTGGHAWLATTDESRESTFRAAGPERDAEPGAIVRAFFGLPPAGG